MLSFFLFKLFIRNYDSVRALADILFLSTFCFVQFRPVDMTQSEECQFLLSRCGWDTFWTRYLDMDSFVGWLDSQTVQDQADVYRFYKKQLQLILFNDKSYHPGRSAEGRIDIIKRT